ncbi:MAG: SpoIID/LytB domain-containing protein [Solirubrobacterales bacterium]|nr:SpoIID/LytB domain-containing protein [Solirubrobacterales bacterium]
MRRSAPAITAVLLATLAAAPAADAASRLVIKGRGYGHGIGMSQYGAYGYAQHGFGYRDILSRYYQDTALKTLSPAPTVRVLLQGGRRAVVTGMAAAGQKKLNPVSTYSVTRSGGRVALWSPRGRKLLTADAPLRLAPPRGAAFVLKGRAANGVTSGRYRGALEVRPSGSGVMAVNALALEDYVRGVISAESPASWPADALRAQAVAARTYAITTRAGGQAFDQYADVRSQMYKGVAAEFPSTDAAVRDTSGEVVTQSGTPVVTYFFSTSGGHTENVENSFIGSLPKLWLRGVDDPFDDASPKHTWGPIRLTARQAQAKLRGFVRGSFRGIKVTQRGVSPRVVRAEVVGTGGVTQVTGPQLRARLGLNDTWATFTYVSSDAEKKQDPPADQEPADDGTGGVEPAAAAARPGMELRGRIDRARAGARLRVQRRDGRRWRTVGEATVGRGGRYVADVPTHGTYRVVWGDVAGPAVRVR